MGVQHSQIGLGERAARTPSRERRPRRELARDGPTDRVDGDRLHPVIVDVGHELAVGAASVTPAGLSAHHQERDSCAESYPEQERPRLEAALGFASCGDGAVPGRGGSSGGNGGRAVSPWPHPTMFAIPRPGPQVPSYEPDRGHDGCWSFVDDGVVDRDGQLGVSRLNNDPRAEPPRTGRSDLLTASAAECHRGTSRAGGRRSCQALLIGTFLPGAFGSLGIGTRISSRPSW